MTGAFLRRETFAHRHSEDGDRGCSYAATSQRAPGPPLKLEEAREELSLEEPGGQ